MLSHADNELMCRVGPDTPMGQAMRRFWVPACQSSELGEPGGDPLHVELLGESFVAFRDREGNVGLLDEFCCHRGASLTVGRVEQCGIRCIYHGWLFAADGTILETPNVADPRFKERFKANAYPVREAGGLIWTYLGPKEKVPPFPDFPWIDLPEENRLAICQVNDCNYVQMLEGVLDSSHLSILHSSALRAAQGSSLNFVQATSHMQFDSAPRIEAEQTEFGMHYAALRSIDGKIEARISAFLAPFWALNPNGDIIVGAVPMTDVKTAYYAIWWDKNKTYGLEPLRSQQLKLVGFDDETLQEYGQTRSGSPEVRPNRNNGFRQNRALMREGHFTGMAVLALEDTLVAVSSGPIRDRTREHLSSGDLAIVQLYRRLIKSARQVADGHDPIGFGLSVAKIKGTHKSLEEGASWQSLVPEHYSTAERPQLASA